MTLTLREVLATIQRAQEAGYHPILEINGEYYGIENSFKEEKI